MRNGKLKDVLFEDVFYVDRTGVQLMDDTCFVVWADENTKDLILSVEGVTNAYNQIVKTKFNVYFDKRYDRSFIQREIEAVILCKGE